MKSKTKIIYAVTDGEYSDYRVEGVFSSKKKAERFIEQYRKKEGQYCEPQIVEWELNGRGSDVAKTEYRALINLNNGSIESEWEYPALVPKNKRAEPSQFYSNPRHTDRKSITVVSYVSKDHARKLAVEAYQKHLREEASI